METHIFCVHHQNDYQYIDIPAHIAKQGEKAMIDYVEDMLDKRELMAVNIMHVDYIGKGEA